MPAVLTAENASALRGHPVELAAILSRTHPVPDTIQVIHQQRCNDCIQRRVCVNLRGTIRRIQREMHQLIPVPQQGVRQRRRCGSGDLGPILRLSAQQRPDQ